MTSACAANSPSPVGDVEVQSETETTAAQTPAGEERLRTRLSLGTIYDIASNPDGTALVLGGSLGVYVIDTLTEEQLYHFENHDGIVTSVDWSPDGKEIISASEDGLAIIWDMSLGEMKYMHQFPDEVYAVIWSPSGDIVAVESTYDKWGPDGNVVFI